MDGKTWLYLFLLLFPLRWLREILLKETSKALEKRKMAPLSFGEMLRYIGL